MGIVTETKKLTLSIGGICCSIHSEDSRFLDVLRARYQSFEALDPATYEIFVQLVPFPALSFDNTGGIPRIDVKRTSTGDGYLVRRKDNPFVAMVNTLSRKVQVKMWDSEYCFDSFLRIFYSLTLVDEGGLLLHASSASDRGRANVFFGPSGSGKTTVARLSQGRTVLTDELAIIKPLDGRYKVYGTPFWGEFTPGRSNVQAELNGLYSLKKDQRNSILPLDKIRAVMDLYRCVLFFSDDSQLLSKILDTCCAVVDKVPIYELHFRQDPSFWEVINDQD